MCEWTRTTDGWVSESEGQITPELFGHVKKSVFRTRLGDDKSMAMELELTKPDGSATIYRLDAGAWVRDNHASPPVVGQQQVGTGSINPVPGPASPAGTPAPTAPARPDHVIQDEGGFIVVDGVKIPKRAPGPG